MSGVAIQLYVYNVHVQYMPVSKKSWVHFPYMYMPLCNVLRSTCKINLISQSGLLVHCTITYSQILLPTELLEPLSREAVARFKHASSTLVVVHVHVGCMAQEPIIRV